MIHRLKKASHLNIWTNIFLMILNLGIGLFFSSISLISKGIESIHDILTAVIIHFTIKINNKKADESHPFGHTRAENIAGYTIGVFMIILGIGVIKEAFQSILNPTIIHYNVILFLVVLIAFLVKGILYFYIKNVLKEHKSASLKANMQDHLNDMLMYVGIFIAIIAIKYEFYIVDSIVGFAIGLIIIKSGLDITKENIGFLMGISATDEIINNIKLKVLEVSEVLDINTIKTQYLGSKVQVELHIALDSKLSLKKSHDIGVEVREKIESMHDIEMCFVHIDVFEK